MNTHLPTDDSEENGIDDTLSASALLAHDRARDVPLLAGADEVGRACLAGPIMAAAVLFNLERLAAGAGRELLEALNDSKRLMRRKRERLAQAVLVQAEAIALVSVPAREIDRIGIDAANVACLERALSGLGERPRLRLVDGDGRLELGADAPAHEWIVHGDGTSATIAAASIVAKVARDRVMARLGERYPGYGFERHAGYGTLGALHSVAENARPNPAAVPPPLHHRLDPRAIRQEFPQRDRQDESAVARVAPVIVTREQDCDAGLKLSRLQTKLACRPCHCFARGDRRIVTPSPAAMRARRRAGGQSRLIRPRLMRCAHRLRIESPGACISNDRMELMSLATSVSRARARWRTGKYGEFASQRGRSMRRTDA
jgi:ribonuclease HII